MTNEFSQQFQPYGFDYYTAGTQPSEIGAAPALKNRLRTGIPLATRNDGKYRGKAHPDLLGFEITLHDFSAQGFNHPEGPFEHTSNGFAWSELVTHRPNELVPPPLGISSDLSSTAADYIGLHWVDAFGTVMFGIGLANNASLFKETSTTNPALSPITYNPGASICSLSRVVDDGVERVAVGRIGAATQLHSDASGTVNLTMHTSTNSTWGIIMSGVGTTAGVPVMLIYAGTTIGRKSTDADLTTAISTEFTGVRAGGFAVGAIKPQGRAERAVWAIPKATNTAGALKFGAEALMELWVTDMELATMDPLRLRYLPDGIRGAYPFRDGLIAFDDYRVVYWDGQTEYNLNLFRQRVAAQETSNVINSDQRRRIRGVLVNGTECGVVWQWFDANATLSGYVFIELYNFKSGSWHNFALPSQSAITTNAVSVVLNGGAVPLSPYTRHLHYATSFASGSRVMRSTFLPPSGESLLWQHSLGSGGSVTTGVPEYNSGSSRMLLPRWQLDGIERNFKVIQMVEFNGNLDHGGSAGWTFQVKIFGTQQDGSVETAYDKTFSQGKPVLDYRRKNTGAVNVVDVQPYLVATPTGSTRKIPQLLPIKIRGVYHREIGKLITETELGELV